jgi:hypothetical protein
MGFDGAFDDGEAEAGALDFLLGVVFIHSIEAPENVREIRAGNADTIIADPDGSGVADFLAADDDLETFVRILFEGVFNEVEEDLGPVARNLLLAGAF